ncbi:MAG: putative toxin-antitoxin system toxin component, PIN family [Candidatus Subteraquimicrobiales bacterium]|nr:putative toxin-antitoxin system toxin component, PIN family [Candidatus Subteraquimicrobiales bacterium]
MLKAVLDTNVIVSGTISSSGAPYEVLEAWRYREFTLIASEKIIEEVERVFEYPRIKNDYNLDSKLINKILVCLKKYSVITSGKLELDVIKDDPTDNMFLSCAEEDGADFIVSGDEHLLNLRIYKGIQIITPQQFLKVLKES